jgi:two-component system OmpR family response regulator
MRVLLVEDDDRIAADAALALTEAGFVPVRERDGEKAWVTGGIGDFAAVVLDLGLPNVDGLTVLKRWREEGLKMPVLVLTARGGWMEKVEGINAGADDFLAKPFHVEELVARVRALTRRAAGLASSVHRIGDLLFDARQMHLTIRGHGVALTPNEFRAFNYLVTHRGRVVPPGELIEHIYGADSAVTTNALEALIRRIRSKVGTDCIETRRGFGYIVVDV